MYEGRVEVCDNGDWGTICDNGWGTRDVNAVCAQLGFGIGKPFYLYEVDNYIVTYVQVETYIYSVASK